MNLKIILLLISSLYYIGVNGALGQPLESAIYSIVEDNKNPVVLLIDPQNDFFERIDPIKGNIIDVLDVANENSARIIVVTFSDSPIEASIQSKLFTARYELYSKVTSSAFTPLACENPECAFHNLDQMLNPSEDEIILMGTLDECCVLETAKDALKKGFKVHINREVVLDQNGIIVDGDVEATENWKALKNEYDDQLKIYKGKPCQG